MKRNPRMRQSGGLLVFLTGSLLFTGLVLTGCATAPVREEVVPKLAEPAAFPAAADAAAPVVGAFWQRFGDPVLVSLVEEALQNNDDLLIAAARVAEARAQVGVVRADLFPEIGTRLGTRRNDPGLDAPPDFATAENRFVLEATVSYELDLWGRLRRQRDAAGERAAATVFDQEAAKLAIAGEVSRVWLGHRVTAAQLSAAKATLQSRQEALDLQTLRAEAGVVDELQLHQSRAEAAAAEAAVASLELAYQRERHALALLVGKDPAELSGDSLPRPEGLPEVPMVPAGLPSDLLTRRPDVKAGEARLMAAAGDLAAARTAYLPSLTLTGNLGSETRSLGDLLSSGTTIWTIAADIVQAVFAGGRFKAGIARTEAQQEQVLVAYKQLARGAFREVYDTLVAQRLLREAGQARQVELEARQKALELAKLRYEAGYAPYLEVLDAQRNLFATEQEELGLRRTSLDNAVNLMLALGGGWE